MPLLSSVIAAMALLAVPAHAAGPPALSIAVSSPEVLYGRALTLAGRVSPGAGGRAIGIYARSAGRPRRHWIASVRPARNGVWRLRIRPALSTAYDARLGAVVTPSLQVAVEPAIATRVLADGAVWVRVGAGRPLAGRIVELQRSTAAGWVMASRAVLDGRSQATLALPVSQARLTMRVALPAGAAGPGLPGASSHPFVVPSTTVTLAATATSVRYGDTLKLVGRVSGARPGGTVLVVARSYGSGQPAELAAVRPGAGGRFAVSVQPRVETSYRVGWLGIETRAVVVGVRPALAVVRLRSGALEARVVPAVACGGCQLRLERRQGRGWSVVGALPLEGASRLWFPPPLRTGQATLRLTLALDEPACGYQATSSAPLAYRARYLAVATSTVRYGHPLRLAGTAPGARAGARVTIVARPFGHRTPSAATTLLTGPDGRWSVQTIPTVQTTYTIGYGGGRIELRTVRVEPRVSVSVLPDGRVAALVAPARRLRGRLVALEGRTALRGWTRLEQASLDRGGAARFPAPASPGVTLRVVISRESAGAGLLGAVSRVIAYRSR